MQHAQQIATLEEKLVPLKEQHLAERNNLITALEQGSDTSISCQGKLYELIERTVKPKLSLKNCRRLLHDYLESTEEFDLDEFFTFVKEEFDKDSKTVTKLRVSKE